MALFFIVIAFFFLALGIDVIKQVNKYKNIDK
jgi:hypothetical protein